jgi:hypothetical protein
MNQKTFEEQIEDGLTDKFSATREAFAKHVPLTREQLVRGLADKDERVRAEFVKRQAEILANEFQQIPVKKERKVL